MKITYQIQPEGSHMRGPYHSVIEALDAAKTLMKEYSYKKISVYMKTHILEKTDIVTHTLTD